MVKYDCNLKASLVSVDFESKAFYIISDLVTNSQNALWDYLNNIQHGLNQFDEKPEVFTSDVMTQILEQSESFSDGFLLFELIEIGVYGMVFIEKEKGSDSMKLSDFFGKDLEGRKSADYWIKEVFI